MDLILFLKAALLGIVEGLTEFLPISSTGHLILAGSLLDVTGAKAKVFYIAIQLGAILAVVWVYRQRFLDAARGLGNDPLAQRFAINLVAGVLPALVLGYFFGSAIKSLLFNPFSVAIALVVGGFVILWAERRQHSAHIAAVDDLTWRDAIKVGLAQCVAMIPGTSRSGATIIGGLLFGLSRKAATEFSFFLAVPTMLAATTYDVVKNHELFSVADVPWFSVGFVAAFIAAMLTVRALMRFISTHGFTMFAWYRIGFGLLVLATAEFGLIDWQPI